MVVCDTTAGPEATPQRGIHSASPGSRDGSTRGEGSKERRRLLPSTPGFKGRRREGEDDDDIADLDDALREEFLDINPSKRYHLATLFHAVNVDGDKVVSVSELREVLNDRDLGGILGSLRSHLRSASESFLRNLLKQLDRDGDGHLTIYEFSVAFADMMNDDGVHVPHRGLYAAQLFALESEFELLEDELRETREELQQEKRQIKNEREHTLHDVEALRADADHTEETIQELQLQLQLANQRLANARSHERSLTLALEKTEKRTSMDRRPVVGVRAEEQGGSVVQPSIEELHGEKRRYAELKALYDELLEQSSAQPDQVAQEQTVPFEQYSELLQSLHDTCDSLDVAEQIDRERSEQNARLELELQQREQSIVQLRQILLGLSASLARGLNQPLECLSCDASIEDFEDGVQDQLVRVLEQLAQPAISSNIESPKRERKDSTIHTFELLDALGHICDMTTAMCDPAHRASVSGAGTSLVDRIVTNIARIKSYFVSISEQSAMIATLLERDHASASSGSTAVTGAPVDGTDAQLATAGPSFMVMSETLGVVTSKISITLAELRVAVDRAHELDLQLELEAQNREAQIDPLEAKVACLQASLDNERQAHLAEIRAERRARAVEVAALEEKLRELEAFGDSLAAVNTKLEVQASVVTFGIAALQERAKLAESVAATATANALADADELDALMQQISDMRGDQAVLQQSIDALRQEQQNEDAVAAATSLRRRPATEVTGSEADADNDATQIKLLTEENAELRKKLAQSQTPDMAGDLRAALGSIASATECLAMQATELVEGHAAQRFASSSAMRTPEHIRKGLYLSSFEFHPGIESAAGQAGTSTALEQFATRVVRRVLGEVSGHQADAPSIATVLAPSATRPAVADNATHILCDLDNITQNFGEIEEQLSDFDARLEASDTATKLQAQLADNLHLEVAAADAKLEAASLEIDMLRQKLKVMEIQQQLHDAAEQARAQADQDRGASSPDVEARLRTMSAALQVSRQVSKALREKVESEHSLAGQHTRVLRVIAIAVKAVGAEQSGESVTQSRSPSGSNDALAGDQTDENGVPPDLERLEKTILSGISGIQLKMDSLLRNLNTLTLKLDAAEMRATLAPSPPALVNTPTRAPSPALAPSPAQGVLSRLRKSVATAQVADTTSAESKGLVKKLRRELKIALADLRSVRLELRLLTLKHATTFDEACTNAYGLHAF